MSGLTGATPITPIAPVPGDSYVAGACNIGPWEIRRRRAYAIAAFAAAGVLLAVLVAVGAPAVTRLIVLLPLWAGMFSWLQARRRFCAGYAVARRSNFGDGHATIASVASEEAHREDMRAVTRMTRDAFLLALVPTILAVLLPL
jgi:hypothetical protein